MTLRAAVGSPRRIGLLLRYRELARALALRELTVRYKRSLLGVGWALAEPVVVVGVYVAVFGHILDADRGVDNYLLFTLLGVVPWLFLSTTLEQSSSTLLEHAPLIRKVYFPREILIGSVVFSRMTTLALCLVFAAVVAVAEIAGGGSLNLRLLWLLPGGLVLLTLLVFGLSLALATLNVVLRDVGFLVRFVLRLAFYACPIVYPLTMVPAAVRPLYDLNPFVGIVWCFQAVAGAGVVAPGPTALASAIAGPVLAFFGGIWLFRRLEATVADLL